MQDMKELSVKTKEILSTKFPERKSDMTTDLTYLW
jgi:hypothetical protein